MTTTTFQVRVCDRCGAQTKSMLDEMPTTGDERIGWRFIKHGYKNTVGSTVDLCPDCYRKFESFMDGACLLIPQEGVDTRTTSRS